MPWTLEVESGTVAVRRARARLIFFQDLAMVQLHLVGIPKLLKGNHGLYQPPIAVIGIMPFSGTFRQEPIGRSVQW